MTLWWFQSLWKCSFKIVLSALIILDIIPLQRCCCIASGQWRAKTHVARWELHLCRRASSCCPLSRVDRETFWRCIRTHAVDKLPSHWQNAISPVHQLLNRYRGKACLCGQEGQGVPKAPPTPHRACSCCFRAGLGRAPGLSWVHGWGRVGVTMLLKETGFWDITF